MKYIDRVLLFMAVFKQSKSVCLLSPLGKVKQVNKSACLAQCAVGQQMTLLLIYGLISCNVTVLVIFTVIILIIIRSVLGHCWFRLGDITYHQSFFGQETAWPEVIARKIGQLNKN